MLSANSAIPPGPIVFVPSRRFWLPNLPVTVTRWPRLVTFLRLIRAWIVASQFAHGSTGRTSTLRKSTVSSFLR